MAGNIEGIEAANGNRLVTVGQIPEESTRDTPEPTFYTIKKGDTLRKIASSFYKDGSKYRGCQKCRPNLPKTGNSHP